MEPQTKESAVKYNSTAAVVTVLFHGALILLCYLYLIHTPIPPFPMGGGGGGLGVEVNLGNSDFGLGEIQDNIIMPDFSTTAKAGSTDNDVLTQDNETTASLDKKTTIKQASDADINQGAIYKGSQKGHNQGVNGGHGDQGNQNGNANSSAYTGNGHGDGTGGGDGGGNGTGHGPGDGDGSGPGKNGIKVSLGDRTIKSLPKPNYNSKDEGIVVVTIWVNKQGSVTKTQAGDRGTTTTNKTLWKLAEDAAKKAKFDVKSNAPEEQKGTITYNFINLN
jgi:hypothetical protein